MEHEEATSFIRYGAALGFIGGVIITVFAWWLTTI